MDLGIQTGQQHRSYDELLALWRHAEAAGLDYAWLYDHFIPVGGDLTGSVFEAWTLLSSLLSRTERIRGGILVTCVMYRNPSVLAKEALTVDHATGGRVEFSLGSCWNAWEAQLLDLPFPKHPERHARLVEAIEVARAVWGGSTFSGEHYAVDATNVRPGPANGSIPIWVGGTGKRIPEAAARADGWNAIFLTLDEYRGHLQRVRAACEAAGRDPATLRLSFGQRVSIANTVEEATERARAMYAAHNVPFDDYLADRFFCGDAATVAEKIAAFRDLGVEQFVMWHEPPFDLDAADQIDAFTQTVAPLL